MTIQELTAETLRRLAGARTKAEVDRINAEHQAALRSGSYKLTPQAPTTGPLTPAELSLVRQLIGSAAAVPAPAVARAYISRWKAAQAA